MRRIQSPETVIGESIGQYRISALLGKGAMGEVYKAEDTKLGRQVAIKILPDEYAQDEMRRRRFLQEARAASSLSHPNVCVIHDIGEGEGGRPYIVMELIEGRTLAQIAQCEQQPIPRIVDIAMQLGGALEAAAAAGVVHRDIKPSNVCVLDRGEIKVLDFGLAKFLESSEADLDAPTQIATQTGQLLGTPRYMSPEQVLQQAVDHRSDLFSVGVILYELLAGRPAFQGRNLGDTLQRITNHQPEPMARFNYDLPELLERIVRKCLEKKPEDRYQSPGEFLVDLRTLRREMESGSRENQDLEEARPAALTIDSHRVPAKFPKIAESPQSSLGEAARADVLINYSPIDDQPLERDRQGWVSQFHRHLAIRVQQLSGENVRITRSPGAPPSQDENPEVKTMVSIVSPPFIKSEPCCRAVESFWHSAEATGTFLVEEHPRLIKVQKAPIAEREIPEDLRRLFSGLMGFEFYEQELETGRIREFNDLFGERCKQRFHERIYDLAYEVCQLLKILDHINMARAGGDGSRQRVIYLATATSDLQEEWDRIRRELVERGHVVLPDSPLPGGLAEVERSVARYMERSDLAIHLLGRHYGATPEDSAESIQSLQVRLSARQARSGDLSRLVWIPGHLQPEDERQVDFVRRVLEEPELLYEADVIQGGLNQFKKILLNEMSDTAEEGPSEPASPPSGRPKVYLVCDRADENDVEALEDYLFDQGLEVCLPALEVSPTEADTFHRENLASCDAILVYFGKAPRAWVDIKLRDALKAVGYGRKDPIGVQGVYVAPPFDRRKERYRTHEASVLQQRDAELAPELDTFIESVVTVSQS